MDDHRIKELGRNAFGIDLALDGHLMNFARLIEAEVKKEYPNLQPVINWLANGCSTQAAIKELEIYQISMRSMNCKPTKEYNNE